MWAHLSKEIVMICVRSTYGTSVIMALICDQESCLIGVNACGEPRQIDGGGMRTLLLRVACVRP